MELNDTNFEQITESGNWVVCYYYSWCKPCHKLIKMLNSSYNNQNKVNLGYVNLDECPTLLNNKKISIVPTLHMISNQKLKDKIVGLMNIKKLKGVIDKKINNLLKNN
jgi:thioredoxin 1